MLIYGIYCLKAGELRLLGLFVEHLLFFFPAKESEPQDLVSIQGTGGRALTLVTETYIWSEDGTRIVAKALLVALLPQQPAFVWHSADLDRGGGFMGI